jgi:glycosyltransferase involved in cell wall biosynthesis
VQDPALRERLGRQAHQYAQQYSWECIADRILALYTSLCTRPALALARPIQV